jgi:hypothetical protein
LKADPTEGRRLLTQKEREIWNLCRVRLFLKRGSGAVVLVEYLALVDAHDPVEADYEE